MTQPDLPPEIDTRTLGLIIVDHGSKRQESNDMLLEVVRLFEQATDYAIVEPAHMELAEPSIATAFDRCVRRGAETVVCHPYFLLPGRHWNQDIPNLVGDAARKHPGVRWLVTAPLGLHPLMAQVMDARVRHCLAHAQGRAEECEICRGTDKCQLRSHDTQPVA